MVGLIDRRTQVIPTRSGTALPISSIMRQHKNILERSYYLQRQHIQHGGSCQKGFPKYNMLKNGSDSILSKVLTNLFWVAGHKQVLSTEYL